jgi:5-methylcytosine-specific restriction endonuclease McrA
MGFRHGSSTGYDYHKCRCEECVAWKRAYKRQQYAKNKEADNARSRAYRQANLERIQEYDRKRSEERKDDPAHREYQRQYAARRSAEKAEATRRWRAENYWWDVALRIQSYCTAREQGLEDDAFEWIKTLDGSSCTYCGDAAETVDHVIPISAGGLSNRDNLVPCCRPCNRKKHKMPVEKFLRLLRAKKE